MNIEPIQPLLLIILTLCIVLCLIEILFYRHLRIKTQRAVVRMQEAFEGLHVINEDQRMELQSLRTLNGELTETLKQSLAALDSAVRWAKATGQVNAMGKITPVQSVAQDIAPVSTVDTAP